MARQYSKSASKKVERAMKKRATGTLRSGGSGKRVTSRKQAIAIGLSEARAEGEKVPKAPKKKSAKKTAKKSGVKRSITKKGAAKKSARTSAAEKSGGRKTTAKKRSPRKARR